MNCTSITKMSNLYGKELIGILVENQSDLCKFIAISTWGNGPILHYMTIYERDIFFFKYHTARGRNSHLLLALPLYLHVLCRDEI